MKARIILAILAAVLVSASYAAAANDTGQSHSGSDFGQYRTGLIQKQDNNPSVPPSQTYYIFITGFLFDPANITIGVGDTIIWTNNDSVSHTVMSDSPGTEINSGSLSNGQTYAHTFNASGIYNYHCSIHTSMTGKVIVSASVSETGYLIVMPLGCVLLCCVICVIIRKDRTR